LVRGIQGSQVHFDFVCAAREDRRTAAGTEKPPVVVAGFALNRHRILREYRGSMKKGPMMLAALKTVTKADPVWASRRYNSDLAAHATAGESVHAASPLKSGGRPPGVVVPAPAFDDDDLRFPKRAFNNRSRRIDHDGWESCE
jgi:hypothetical protein